MLDVFKQAWKHLVVEGHDKHCVRWVNMGICFLGDIMLGRQVLPAIQLNGLASLFQPLLQLIKGHTVVANLECALTTSEPSVKEGEACFFAPPTVASEIAACGVGLVSLANNHVFDCGMRGLTETIRALDAADIAHTGAGMDLADATKPVKLTINNYTIGLVAFSYSPPAGVGKPGVAYLYDDTAEKTIGSIRDEVDFIIAMGHTGVELFQYPLFRDQRAYRKIIDAGADLVIGGHSHCVQPMEFYRGKAIFYSLGDCIFDHHSDESWESYLADCAHPKRYSLEIERDLPRQSIAVLVSFDDRGIQVHYEPLVMRSGPGSRVMDSDERSRWMADFKTLCERLEKDETIALKRLEIEDDLLLSLRKRGIL